MVLCVIQSNRKLPDIAYFLFLYTILLDSLNCSQMITKVFLIAFWKNMSRLLFVLCLILIPDSIIDFSIMIMKTHGFAISSI